MLGSIPQQDIFQRVMSARTSRIAALGPIIGGAAYLLFSFVPMYIAAAAIVLMPSEIDTLIASDAQHVLPTVIIEHMPAAAKTLFFGALLSAILSTASSTILAPSTVFVQNVLKHALPTMSDRQELRLMRLTVLGFTALVLVYTIAMDGTSVYDLVSSSYQVPLVGAFVPLVCGLYWKRANNRGAIASIVLGLGTWILFMATSLGEAFPQQLAGLLMAGVGMWAGSLVPERQAHS
jgi:solute:Na+ symporter, SSS family